MTIFDPMSQDSAMRTSLRLCDYNLNSVVPHS